MKTVLKILAVLIVVAIVGLLVWAYILPQLNQKTATETINDIPKTSTPASPTPASNEPVVVSTAKFKALNNEPIEGSASLVKAGDTYFIRLEDDFKSTGPDLYVGLGSDDKADTSNLISKLKAGNGGQNYEIPASIDPSNYGQILIYCKLFKIEFGSASIET